MIVHSLLLILGLALIIKGGDLFVSASVRIAELMEMPRVVIGSTLVSLATTSPELVVSIMSGFKGESGLAVGNAIGSCICNIGLILGVTAMMRQIHVHPAVLKTPLVTMVLFAVALFVMTLNLRLSPGQGIALVLLGVAYFIFDFRQHQRHARPKDEAEAGKLERELVQHYSWLQTGWGASLQFAGGAGTVIVGSKFLVDSAIFMASALGVPSIIIGLTVVAIGTSLPELITAIASSRRNVSDLAVGNILGANVANLTLVVGSAAGIHEVTMSRITQLFNFPLMLAIMIVLLAMLLSGKRISRREGMILLGLYGSYLLVLIVLTLVGKT